MNEIEPVEVSEIELAKFFIDYAETKQHLDYVEMEIQAAVLALKESRTIAGVQATYSAPTHLTNIGETSWREVPAKVIVK